ncbi:MAG TPA: helix-turn-helix domain-containing protein [Propioniciclava tarda]|nr:helix-turn-helix domain-containing protein [Propioniciclava tarda]
MRRELDQAALLDSPARQSIMSILSNLPPLPTETEPHARRDGMTASELGQRLGLHVTTVRFHVDQLVGAHLLRFHDVRLGVGRPRRHYSVDPSQLETHGNYDAAKLISEVLSDAFAHQLRTGEMVTPAQAAERWVKQFVASFGSTPTYERALSTEALIDKIAVLVDLLERWSYSLTVDPSPDQRFVDIGFPGCPLRYLADRNPEVALSLHESLLRSALTSLGAAHLEITTERDPATQEWRTRIAQPATPA